MGSRGGRIINLADVGATRAWPGYIPYAISKAGVVMLTRGLAAALAPRIQVNAVAPGAVLLPRIFPRDQEADPGQDPDGAARSPGRCRRGGALLRHLPGLHHRQVLYVDGGATAV